MITKIELDGFKTFQDFELELSPFQVIVGPNGVGKSNLFDALRLLSQLADNDLRSAFGCLRGEAGELFTTISDGQAVSCMRLAVEILVEPSVTDSWGAKADIKFPRLRYELEISRRSDEHGLERLYVTRESLEPIRRNDDRWFKRHMSTAVEAWQRPLKAGRNTAFISTEEAPNRGLSTIHLHRDGRGSRKASPAEKVERTVLSGVTGSEFPHAFAAREEMRSWAFLHLNPGALRQPGSMLATSEVSPDGSNLPSALARMQAEDPLLLKDVERDLANLVPGVIGVEVNKDLARDRYVIQVKTQDGRTFSARVLSDGTLRLLALATLRNDPQRHGVLCLEEPENGLHPFRIENMAQLLQGLATDFSDPDQGHEPLRQLLVNTHSPLLVSQPGVVKNVLFAYSSTRIQPRQGRMPMRVTRVVPVKPYSQPKSNLNTDDPEAVYTHDQVVSYLSSADTGAALSFLQAAVG
jgi:predicted ATPase